MSRKVLLLDDDDRFREIVRGALTNAGLEVMEAGKGRDARELLKTASPNLAIVDGLLPDENGFEFIAHLRDIGSEIPVVFVSAFWRDIESYRKLTRDLGVALVMHKPLDAARLADRVAVLLRSRKPKSSEPRMTLPHASPELVREFAATLPARLVELAAALVVHRTDPANPDARYGVRRIAHQLRGSAGSYGFEDIATVAATIDEALATEAPVPAGIEAEVEALAQKHADAGAEEANDPVLPQVVDRPLILVADDDTMFLEDMVDIAEAQILDLQVAGTPEDALELARVELPDVAFIGMPFGEPDRSLELVETLREQHPSLPVAVIGLDDTSDVRIGAVRAGAGLFLSHPVEAEGLARAVARMRRRDPSGPDAVLILAATDDDILSGRLENLEREGISLTCVGAGELMSALDHQRPDVVLVDEKVGPHSGADICRMLRATLRHAEVPLLLFGGKGRNAERRVALSAGADDALSKLDVATVWAERVHLAAASVARRPVPAVDPVTHLRGRAHTLMALSVKLAESRRHSRSFVLALLDIDDLEEINIEHGRSAGDRILGSLASALRSRFRSEDVRGRLGPDELVIGFADADPKVTDILGRVRETFAGLELTTPAGGRYGATYSIGVATFPADGKSVPQLLALAEARLVSDRERSAAGD